MAFELTRELIDQLKDAIERQDTDACREFMADLHPADIADIFNELDIEESKFLYLMVEDERAADILIELDQDIREQFINVLPGEVIARQFIENMDSDDAADVIGELSAEKKEEILSNIEDIEQAGDIVDLLAYDQNTAGGLMAKELIKVNENWNIVTSLKEMRKQAEHVDEIYYVYVIDDEKKLRGTLSLKKLLLSPSASTIRNVYNQEVISVQVDTPSEEVANIMDRYDLVALPVVDAIGRLVGRITIDDVVDVIREEAEKDYQLISGITEDIQPSDNVLLITRARLPWLLIGLVGGIFGAQVIGMYEYDLGIYPEMAFFIPLIAAMGGNVGVQSSAIIVQSIASNTMGIESPLKRVLKEFSVASLNGIICSLIIFTYNVFFADSMALTLTVSAALFSVIIFASIFGTFIPLALHRLKIDPALATGPFITTLNDILGLFVYLMIGRVMYGAI